VPTGQRLLLGFSGGLDSCVLLHLLASLRAECGFELAALHVNHGISLRADEWQQFCAEVCAVLQVPFGAQRVAVPLDGGLGLEAAARAARYAALLAQPADRVVLAHHRDDQAETLLLQLLRGAGIRGLAAMPVQSEGNGRAPAILRPLLDIPRATLFAYARAHHLVWIEDESNLDLAYDRNFLRHHIFPELEQRFPASRSTLARSAAHLAEAAALLDEVAMEDAARWIGRGRLDVAGLRVLSEPRAKNLLRHWLSAWVTNMPSTRRLQDIYRQLLDARPDAMLGIALEGGQVRRYRGEAWFEHSVSTIQPETLEWHGESELRLPGGHLLFRHAMGVGISIARLAGDPLQIRQRSGGERLRLHPHGPARSLKNLFQEAAVPAWQRMALPLLYQRDELIAIPGIGVSSVWQAGMGEEGLLSEWRRD
jgi:tRNA(Ile)-lysidine synthase